MHLYEYPDMADEHTKLDSVRNWLSHLRSMVDELYREIRALKTDVKNQQKQIDMLIRELHPDADHVDQLLHPEGYPPS